jgi:hypothetical protein
VNPADEGGEGREFGAQAGGGAEAREEDEDAEEQMDEFEPEEKVWDEARGGADACGLARVGLALASRGPAVAAAVAPGVFAAAVPAGAGRAILRVLQRLPPPLAGIGLHLGA